MPRQVRIEYPGAVYHAMARGDRREDIVRGDGDREAFVSLLAELVGRTGWEMFAWVLMSNHYHLVFKTPEANLVAGMKWLQNTWTKRFNARHGLWGHVFGQRYKAVVVEENEHLECLIDYVHLNPVRAGLIRGKMELGDYRWSSLGDYLLPPGKRSGWVRVERGLQQRGYRRDTAAERRRYLEHLEAIARDEGGIPPLPGGEGRSMQSTLQRGWFFGAEEFREKMLKKLHKAKESPPDRYDRSSGYYRQAGAGPWRVDGGPDPGDRTAGGGLVPGGTGEFGEGRLAQACDWACDPLPDGCAGKMDRGAPLDGSADAHRHARGDGSGSGVGT